MYILLIILSIFLTSCINEDDNKTSNMKEIDNRINYLMYEVKNTPAFIVNIDKLASSYLLEHYGEYPSGITEDEVLYLLKNIDDSIEDEKD